MLCEKNPRDLLNDHNPDTKLRTNLDLLGGGGSQGNKLFKNEDKKLQRDSMNKLLQLNVMLQDLLFSAKELSDNVERSSAFIQNDLALKIKSDLQLIEL